MSRASVCDVLNSEVVVDIYQLMELLVGQVVVNFSMDESKYAPVPLASRYLPSMSLPCGEGTPSPETQHNYMRAYYETISY
jgi:hypothetical protein